MTLQEQILPLLPCVVFREQLLVAFVDLRDAVVRDLEVPPVLGSHVSLT